MFRQIILVYIMAGLEEEWWLNNCVTATKKPNLIYRLYKMVDREFRIEANDYVNNGGLYWKHHKFSYR